MSNIFNPKVFETQNTNPELSKTIRNRFSSENDIEVGVKRRGDNLSDFNTQTFFWIVITPLIILILLIILRPTFVKMSSDEKLDYSSVLLWTLIISLIVWILFWGFSKCRTC